MSYATAVLVAIVICLATFGIGSLTFSLLSVSHGGQALTFWSVLHGILELVGASLIVGWISGSAWYLIRR
jgi:hypothetical protein